MSIAVMPAPAEQAGKILPHVAGYVGYRTIEIGLKHGLFERITAHSDGISAEKLATEADMDPLYVSVWARAAYGAQVLELTGDNCFTLAPQMDKLLLDEDFPGYAGALFKVLSEPELRNIFKPPCGKR